MINCTCVIQAGQAPDRSKEEIQDVLNRFVSDSFGEMAKIAWIPVPQGGGFTAGKQSSTSVVSMASNKRLSPERRESLLRELVAVWTSATACKIDEIVAVIADPRQT